MPSAIRPRLLVLAVVATLVATACGTPDPDAGETADDDVVEVRLAIGGEPDDGYDPTLGWGRYGSPLFQSTLLRRDADLELVGDLATGYEVSDDRLTWTVTIRDDATFTDGEPVTAEDVAYTYRTAATSGGVVDLTVLADAVAVDDTTVELRLSEPQSTFVNRLATLGIVPAHAHGPDYGRNPVGSGPFQLVRWEQGQELVAEVNPDYYGEVPDIDRLVLVFAEEDARLALARTGEVDLISVAQSLAVNEIDGMELVPVASVDNRGIMLPFLPDTGDTTDDGSPIGNDVTSDLAIRRALNLAVDRDALVDGVLVGFGSPAYGPVDGLPWFEPNSVIEDADPDRAAALLAEAGWEDTDGDGVVERDGTPARFTVLYPAGDATRQGLSLAVRDMVAPIGIQIEAEGVSWDEIGQRMHTDAVVFGWGSHDQTEMYNLYHSRFGGVEFFNPGFYADDRVDSYLDLAMGATSEEEAQTFWRAAQLDDDGNGFTAPGDAAWAWLVNLDHTYYVSECLDIGDPQVEPHGHGWPITAGITGWTWTCP